MFCDVCSERQWITVTGLQKCSALLCNGVLFYFAWPFSVDVQHQSRPRASLCGVRARLRARACVFGPDEHRSHS